MISRQMFLWVQMYPYRDLEQKQLVCFCFEAVFLNAKRPIMKKNNYGYIIGKWLHSLRMCARSAPGSDVSKYSAETLTTLKRICCTAHGHQMARSSVLAAPIETSTCGTWPRGTVVFYKKCFSISWFCPSLTDGRTN